MFSISRLTLIATAAGLLAPVAPALAQGTVRAAVSATTTMGSFLGLPTNLINQSGLLANYVSGATDFTSFTASTKHVDQTSAVSWFSSFNNPTGFLSFDLGANYNLEGVAIWSSNGASASLKDFKVFVDSDNNPLNGAGTEVLSSTMAFYGSLTPDTAPAQTFSFATVSARYLNMQVLSNANNSFITGFSEIAFREVSAVPEPGSWAMMVAGMAALGAYARRGRKSRHGV